MKPFFCFILFYFLDFVFCLIETDSHPSLIVIELYVISQKATDEECAVHASHTSNIIDVAAVSLQPALIKGVPQLSLRNARKALVVDLQAAQIAMIVLAAALLGRLTVTRIRRLTPAAASASTRSDPLVIVLAPLVAERAVLPHARVTVLAPPCLADEAALLEGDLRLSDGLPLLRGANAPLTLDGRNHRELI